MIIIKRKYYVLLIVIVLFILSSCSTSLSPTKIDADAAVIYYNDRSFSKIIEDEAIVNELTDAYNAIDVKKTDDELDLSSAINVIYYNNKKEKAVLIIDKNGIVCLYRDMDNRYKVIEDSFNYERLEDIYKNHED